MTFTEIFGGTTVYPSQVSYRAVALNADVTLAWPTEVATDSDVVAAIMDVTAAAGPYTITMPPADQVSVGQTALIFNVGANSFSVETNTGGAIVTIAAGQARQLYLTDNTTVAGTWRVVQYGVGTSGADASMLAGYGLRVAANTLNQITSVTSGLSTSPVTVTDADLSSLMVWSGGAGVFNLPNATSAAIGDGWFVNIRNGGSGTVTITPPGGQLINGVATASFEPGDSATIICDGSNFFTVGYGQSSSFSFDYTSIDLSTSGATYTLSGAELNRISYLFYGTPATDVDVIVPNTVQQYWVTNSTTTGGTGKNITVKTAAGSGITIAVGANGILYCNGTNVVNATTSSVTFPIGVAQGGTGATTASAAQANLGGTTVGRAVFTAASKADARTAIDAAVSGINTDITQITGLSDGSAAAPAVTFASDTNTGVFRQGANAFSVATDGLERLRVGAYGEVVTGYASSGVALSTTISAKFQSFSGTYTDNATAASGTVTHGPLNILQSAAIASTNATVTYTNASTLYVAGAPTAGTNVTITNPYAVYVVSGNNYLGSGSTGIGGGSLIPVTKLHVSTNVDDDGITVESTNAGANPGPVVSIYRNSASPANSDSIGFIRFQGNNSGATLKEYGSIRAQINTVTAGAETSTLVFQVLKATSIIQPMSIGGTNGLVTIGTGLSITNVAVTAPAATDGNVYSGSYTPTNVAGSNANVSSVTFAVARYMRVGNAVTVSGAITLTPTAANTNTTFLMSIPVGGTFTSVTQGNGSGVSYTISDRNVIAMRADTSGSTMLVRAYPSTTGAVSYSYTFTYEAQ